MVDPIRSTSNHHQQSNSLHQSDLLTSSNKKPHPSFSETDTIGHSINHRNSSSQHSNQQSVNLRRRLLQTVLPTILIPLAIVHAIGSRIIQQRSETRVKQQLSEQAKLTSQDVAKLFVNMQQTTEMIATNPLVIRTVRTEGQKAESDNLTKLPIDQIEQNFAATKLLAPDAELNNYLKGITASTGLAELFFTEQHGFNVAASQLTSDFVQHDEEWWQQARSQSLWVSEPELDQSSNRISVAISQAIVDPASGAFLGAIKAVVPSGYFAQAIQQMQAVSLGQSQQIQVLSGNGQAIATLAANTPDDLQVVLGGDTIKTLAMALAKANRESSDPQQVTSSLNKEYSLQNLKITSLETGKQTPSLTAAFQYDSRQYALVTVPQTNWIAVVSIDRAEMMAASRELLLLAILTFLLLSVTAITVIRIQSRRLTAPLQALSDAAEQVASGDLEGIALSSNITEIDTLAQTLNHLVAQVKHSLSEQTTAAEQARLLADITGVRALDDPDVRQVFNKALESARCILGVDRMVIYRFNPDWSGFISHEAVAAGLPRALNNEIEDACIPEELLDAYRNDRVVPTPDVFNAGFHPRHLQLLERLQIKANLVVPILNQGQLFGLLIAHHCQQIHPWKVTETSFLRQLAVQLGIILDRVALLQSRGEEAKRSQLLKDVVLQVVEADAPETILAKLPVAKIREALKTDRVIVYWFNETWQGTIVAESVATGYPRALGAQIDDPCFTQHYIEKYQQGRVQAISNVYTAGLTDCHLKQLEPFGVKANLVAPILQNGRLLGLLIAHHCSEPRAWELAETIFFAQAATQVGLAFDRAYLLEQRKLDAEQSSRLAVEQQRQRETLQNQLLTLLEDIEGAAQGDLTVRAEVTSSEIGTVADFFNSIIESLRQIVNQVKSSALEVSYSIGENKEAIRQLSDTALMQAKEITATLQSMQQTMQSIETVANSAQQAAEVASQASKTSEVGQASMDAAVQYILGLRSMIGETTKKVKSLGESSQEISKIVSLIEKIAMQTNLLSINAGIEAARAGEEGQGFAAVAEEIGKLAAQSTAATQEIEEMIRSIQQETYQVATAMEQSTVKVMEGTHRVEDAKKSLGEILTVSRHINDLLRSISEATILQTQTSQTVTERMQDIARATEQNSEASRKVASSLQQAIEMALALETSVRAFKID
jgi:methyl-accepting chemotaxis protein